MATGGESLRHDEKICKRVIRKVTTKFVECLDPLKVVDEFLVEEFVTNTKARDIREHNLTSDKNRLILDLVSATGVKGYNLFKVCLRKSKQQPLVEYLEETEAELQQMEEEEEETDQNPEKGYKCFACNVSCDDLEVFEKHIKSAQHENVVTQQEEFAEKFTPDLAEEEGDHKDLASKSLPDSYRNYCYLCKVNFTSASHARSHLKGKPHQKRQAQFDSMGQELPKPLEKETFETITKPANSALNHAKSREHKVPINSLPEDMGKSGLKCDICNVSFTSQGNAKQHYNGEKHKKKERLFQKEKEGELWPLECTCCKCKFTGQESAADHFSSEKHKKRADKTSESDSIVTPVDQPDCSVTGNKSCTADRCDICNVKFSGPENATQHYASPKHKKKQKQKEGAVLPLLCSICNCTFTGPESAEAHFTSAKHKKKERESSYRSMTGQHNIGEHYQNTEHKQKVESKQIETEKASEQDNSIRDDKQAVITNSDVNDITEDKQLQELEDAVNDLGMLSLGDPEVPQR